MKRRKVIATSALVVGTSLAGCLGDGDGHLDVDGVEVPLISVADAIDWHADGSAVFLDARSRSEYEELRIAGADHSEARDGLPEGDPTEDLASDTRIVTYCVCPHTLAGRRGASLIEDGFTDVQALDEGLQEWFDQDYPVEGRTGEVPPAAYH